MARLKRAYEPATPEDGTRVLVDRLWPRGVRKEDARIDGWAKEVAPSTELRRWYRHDPARFEAFAARYRRELVGNDALAELRALDARETVTLVYAAKDARLAHARPAGDARGGRGARVGRTRAPAPEAGVLAWTPRIRRSWTTTT